MIGSLARGAIQDAMRASLDAHRLRTALVGGGEELSYAQLGARIDAASHLLRERRRDVPRRDVPRRDVAVPLRIGFCLANSVDYVVWYFGALFAGDVPFLLDANFNIGEIEAIRGDCTLDALILEPAKAVALGLPGAADAVPIGAGADTGTGTVLLPLARPEHPAFALRPSTSACRFTSGTTGRPKCLEFSGEAVAAAARHWVSGTGMDAADRVLCLAALSNGLAFNTSLLSTFLAGGELHIFTGLPLTRPIARWIRERGITRLVAFPALYRHFAAPGGPGRTDMASLRYAISAGAPLWPDVREEFRARYGLDVSDYYGIAETGPCTFETDPTHRAGLGQPLPGVEIRIASGPDDDAATGEIVVRTASMASGYLNYPDLFASRLDADGFYHSGDRGRIVDGRLHLAGRTQDHINVAGRKIDPSEIVAVVSALDGVEEAVAFPDEDLNRETLVHLVVVAATRELTSSMVADACRSRLAPYKIPGRISFVGEIPRNGIGKPRIAALREHLTGG
jgi:acyl-CoA synthetase (AMP-forming)/AMP-acid ligase II